MHAMIDRLFLASSGLGGLPALLPARARDLRLVFVPTASVGEVGDGPAPWVDADRAALTALGFQVEGAELELSTATSSVVERAVAGADVLYLAGGNTFFLQHWLNQHRVRELLVAHPPAVYAGASAGAIVAGPDIGYVSGADDPAAAPGLLSTSGLGLVDLAVLPHIDHPDFAGRMQSVVETYDGPSTLVPLRDDQAVVVQDGAWRVVDSL